MDRKNILHEVWSVTQVVLARLRFIMVFLVAALVVGYWDSVKNHVDKWTRPAVAPDSLAHSDKATIEYYCSMHPHVIRTEPGNCPICGMPLSKREKGHAQRLPADVLARVQLTPTRIALANVRTTPVEYRSLTYEVSAPGVLDYDETKLARISARVAGRADKLFVTYVGQPVKQGDPLYSLYSPEVFTALREYLYVQKRFTALPADVAKDMKSDAATVLEASKQRLLLWGVSDGQLEEFAKAYQKDGKVESHLTITSPISGVVVAKNLFEGGYVQTGQNVFTVADMSRLWLQARIYERDVPLVNVGDAVTVNVDALPNESFEGKVTYLAFAIDPQTRTLDARVEVDNPQLKLRPGLFATAMLQIPVKPLLSRYAGRGQGEGSASFPTNSNAAKVPSSQPIPSVPLEGAKTFAAALESYIAVQKKLAADSIDGVPEQLSTLAEKIKPLAAHTDLAPEVDRINTAIAAAKDKKLDDVRESLKTISSAMIVIGKAVGLPADGPKPRLFVCTMSRAPWIQLGAEKANPYQGSTMPTCGDDLPPLPTATATGDATTKPTAMSTPAGRVLAVPRSAVIDTGKNKIVYVESAPGVYDMHAVKLGPAAGEFYPVIEGLTDGQSVVTVGAFLIDSEIRLNPSAAAQSE